ncbi:MAG TPA: hydroxymethylbilane synthase [Rhizomicrobium sp.]|jgi:hydroxymethylbilane synthase
MAQSKPLRIGTRGSKLALVQANMVKDALAVEGSAVEIVIVKTSGDRIQDRSLADAGGKGLFTKELEEALFAGEADIAVHSMKDVPVALPKGLAIGAILPREDPRDAFLSNTHKTLQTLPKGARVGTSSVRRQALVARARPDVKTVLLRGNVDTRLAKLDAGNYDAIILASAGLNRLGLAHRITAPLEIETWLPALAQGAIGIEHREADSETAAAIMALNHEETAICLACERAFQATLDGSCKTPIGGYASFKGELVFQGEVLSPDGKDFAGTDFHMPLESDPLEEAAQAGRAAARAIRWRAERWLEL